jgi:hypothetical protein
MHYLYRMCLVTWAALLAACIGPTRAVVDPIISVSQPKPIAAADDIFNIAAQAELTPGVIAIIRVSPDGIELQQALLMLVPKHAHTMANSSRDRIVVTLHGNGGQIAQATVPDPTALFVEGPDGSAASLNDRSIAVAIPTPNFVDTLEVTVASTGQKKAFAVSSVMKGFCAAARDEPACRTAEAH